MERGLFISCNRNALPLEPFVLDAVRFDRLIAEPALLVFLVVGKVAFEPFDVTVALEGQNVRREAVEEEAIMRDDDGAAWKVLECGFKRTERLGIEIIGRLVQQQKVAALLQELRKMYAVPLAA